MRDWLEQWLDTLHTHTGRVGALYTVSVLTMAYCSMHRRDYGQESSCSSLISSPPSLHLHQPVLPDRHPGELHHAPAQPSHIQQPQVGHIFARRVLLECWPWGLPTILLFLYCGSQAAMELKNYQIKQRIKQ